MNKSFLKYSLLVSAFVITASTAANAAMFFPTPEVDPTLAIGAITLIAGSVAVLRARSAKK